jgi:putative membrane protein
MLASAFSIAIGWYYVRHHNIHAHRRMMLIGAAFGSAFFVSYALSTLMIGDSLYGGPHRYAGGYQTFLQIHVTLATAAAVFGVLTLRFAFRRAFRKHRKVAPWTAVLWLISAASGLAVFLFLFVIFPTGPSTTSLIQVLFR